MNVYDEAHNLERAIRGSEEYKQYMEVKARIAEKPELDKMIKDYQAKQMELQAKQMMGEEITEEVMKQIQPLYAVMMQDPVVAEYLQCEMRFGMMMSDVYKILGDLMTGE